MRRARAHHLILLSILLSMAVPAFSAPAAELVSVGVRSFSYGDADNRCRNDPTGEKPQSKLWYHDGFWWASLCNETLDDYHIYRLDPSGQSWVDTGVLLDPRPNTKADVLWDEASGKLYVASHVFTLTGSATGRVEDWGRLYRYSYDAAQQRYSLDAGFPVDVTRGKSETLTLARDGTGRLWVTYVEDGKVMINHSLGDDLTWGTPTEIPVNTTARNVSSDDISAVIAFGGNRIGIMWSNNLTDRLYFAVHRDADPPSVWQPLETPLPGAGCSSGCVDDHINLVTVGHGAGAQIFATTKTELTNPDDPLIYVLRRHPNAQWEGRVFARVRDGHTRPIAVADDTYKQLYVFATAPVAGGTIYYKHAAFDDLTFAPRLGNPAIHSPLDPQTNNVTSTKQTVDVSSGLLVMASDRSTRYYLHNLLPVTPPPRPVRLSLILGGGDGGG